MQYLKTKKVKTNKEYMSVILKVKIKKIKELSKIGISVCDLLETVINVWDADLINYIYEKDNIPHPKIKAEEVQA